MSVKQMALVWEHEWQQGEQLVMLSLTDHAHDDGTEIRPSNDLTAWKTGYSKRQVQRIVKGLWERGILVVERRSTETLPTVYKIDWAKAVKKEPFFKQPKLTTSTRRQILDTLQEAGGCVCLYCGREGDTDNGPDGKPWHVDRVVPGSKGGRYEGTNVALSCGSCNRRKKDGDAKMAPQPENTSRDAHARGVPSKMAPEPSEPSEPSEGDHIFASLDMAPEPSKEKESQASPEPTKRKNQAPSSPSAATETPDTAPGQTNPFTTFCDLMDFANLEVGDEDRKRVPGNLRKLLTKGALEPGEMAAVLTRMVEARRKRGYQLSPQQALNDERTANHAYTRNGKDKNGHVPERRIVGRRVERFDND